MTPPTHQSEPGGEQDQGHGVVLHDQEEVYQQPISLISGSVEDREQRLIVTRVFKT